MAIFDERFYHPDTKDVYSDGPIEQEYLRLVQAGTDLNTYVQQSQSWPEIYHFSHMRTNILNWYPFRPDCRILEIGAGCGALTGMLCDKAASVVSVELTRARAQILYERHRQRQNLVVVPGNFHEITYDHLFDYIVVVGILEYAGSYTRDAEPYHAFLRDIAALLAPGGVLLLAIENRFGIKYFAGAPEDHLDKPFVGIGDYSTGCDKAKVRTFTKGELTYLLGNAGLSHTNYYYPMQDYKFPTAIHTAHSLKLIEPSYATGTPQQILSLLFNEKEVYAKLAQEGTAETFANSFLVEARAEAGLTDSAPIYVKISNDRKDEYRVITRLMAGSNGIVVEKIPENPHALQHLVRMNSFAAQMSAQGPFPYLESRWDGNSLAYDFLHGETIEQHWDRVLEKSGYKKLMEQLSLFREQMLRCGRMYVPQDIYSKAFQEVFGPAQWPQEMLCQPLSNVDLAADNFIYSNGEYFIIDYEWVLPLPVPIEYIVWRTLSGYYAHSGSLRECIDYPSFCTAQHWDPALTIIFIQWNQAFADYVGNGAYYYNKMQGIRPAYLHSESLERENSALKELLDAQNKHLSTVITDSRSHAEMLAALLEDRKTQIQRLNEQCCEFSHTRTLLDEANKELRKKNSEIAEIRALLNQTHVKIQQENDALTQAKVQLDEQIEQLRALADRAQWERDVARAETDRIFHSLSYRITKPLRLARSVLARMLRSCRYSVIFAVRCVRYVLHFGPVRALKRLRQRYLERQTMPMPKIPVPDQEPYASKPEREERYIFSILTPLYNTPEPFLKELLSSVKVQRYTRWELCLADGSDAQHENVGHLAQQYAAQDSRIRYRKLDANLGIALNTCAAYEQSSGNYIVLLDHDDILTADALLELAAAIDMRPDCDMLYSDRAIFSSETRSILAYHYLPGYSPDYLRSTNYMSHLNAFSRDVLDRVGFERAGYDGSQDYDLVLRCAEAARGILHIPKVLYWCRASEGSVALDPRSKLYAYDAAKKAIGEHIARSGYPGTVELLEDIYAYRIHYALRPARISILIPNRDHRADLEKCVTSILSLSTYNDYEIIIIENNSQQDDTFILYDKLAADPRVRIIKAQVQGFNFSALNNIGARAATGHYLLLLNNDTQVITPGWMQEMVMFAQRHDVGAVGAKLLYPNGTLQHCGLIIGLGGNIASHYGFSKPAHERGYMNTLVLPQNYSAVTAACLLVSKDTYFSVGGLDEENFAVGLNDVDFCLKLREQGLYNVWTPYAELYHHESASRGSDLIGERKARFEAECQRLREKWSTYFTEGDPFDTVNFKGW